MPSTSWALNPRAVTGSVPLARYVIGLMLEHEKFEENPDFDPHHKGIVSFAECTPEQQAELIAQDPDYGEMICSCEEVTKAEILQAIHNPLGVSTMTGIKYRTRAMMGGCQGGFCQMKIEHFIEQELGTEPENVRYSRQGSWVLTGNMREGGELSDGTERRCGLSAAAQVLPQRWSCKAGHPQHDHSGARGDAGRHPAPVHP